MILGNFPTAAPCFWGCLMTGNYIYNNPPVRYRLGLISQMATDFENHQYGRHLGIIQSWRLLELEAVILFWVCVLKGALSDQIIFPRGKFPFDRFWFQRCCGLVSWHWAALLVCVECLLVTWGHMGLSIWACWCWCVLLSEWLTVTDLIRWLFSRMCHLRLRSSDSLCVLVIIQVVAKVEIQDSFTRFSFAAN